MEARTPIAPVTLSGPLLISASTKGNQLQRPASKNVLQAFPLFRIQILCLYRFGKRSQNLILPSSITMKNYAQYQIIIWFIDLIHYIMIEGFHTCNSSVQHAFLQKAICNFSNKNTKNISDSKIHLYWRFLRFFGYLFHIITCQPDSYFFKTLFLFDSIQCQFHNKYSFLHWLILIFCLLPHASYCITVLFLRKGCIKKFLPLYTAFLMKYD